MAVTSAKMDLVTKFAEKMVQFRDLAEIEIPAIRGKYDDVGGEAGLPTQQELDASAFAGMTVLEFTTAVSSIETLLTGLKAVSEYSGHLDNIAKVRRSI
jgi:hypothetical protein